MSENNLFPTAVSSGLTSLSPLDSEVMRKKQVKTARRQKDNAKTKSKALPTLGPRSKTPTSLYTPPPKQSIRSQKRTVFDPIVFEVLNDSSALPSDERILKKLIRQLSILQQQHIESAEYYEAQHTQRTIQLATKKLEQVQTRSTNSADISSLMLKKQELESIVDNFLQDWNQQYNEFFETARNEARIMNEKHEKELEDYDETSPNELPPQYRKRSVSLIEMREKERMLALNKQFKSAHQMKVKADEAEIEEEQQQIQKMLDDFLKKRQKIIEKQEEQKSIYFTHADDTRERMLQQRDKLLEGYIKRIDLIQAEIEKYCEASNVKQNDIPSAQLSSKRAKTVCEGELSYPIPRMRPGTSFTKARKQK